MTDYLHDPVLDKPGWIAICTVLWMEVIEFVPFLTDTKLLLQSIIGILTIIYLVLKIKHIHKVNKQIDKENGKEEPNTGSSDF